MDGQKNAITEKELKTDIKAVTNKKSEVKIKRPSSKKDVTAVPEASVLQKGRADGTRSSPEAGVLGVRRDASATPDIRSGPGGWAVEVRVPNAASGSGQLHTGQSSSATPENRQPDPMSESKGGRKPSQRFSTPDVRERPPAPTAATSPAAENSITPKPAPRSAADILKNPSAAPKPASRTPATENTDPKPAPRSPAAALDNQSGTAPQCLNPESQNAPKPAPRSSASLRASPSRPDDAVRMESRSNHQFIADENVSVWSSSVQIENARSLSTESICRICHESDQVEPLISPCLCRGTLSLVHRACLQHWLAESDSSSCELCRFIYVTKRVPKYSILGSVVAWMRQNRRQRKALLVDTLGMIAFVPFATMITYVAAALADGIEYQESPSWTDVTIRFAIVTFISMMTTIDVAYATYWMLRAQHHFSSWYSWYRRNSDVTLLPHQQQ